MLETEYDYFDNEELLMMDDGLYWESLADSPPEVEEKEEFFDGSFPESLDDLEDEQYFYYRSYCNEVERECVREELSCDRIALNCTYTSFVSTSKGRSRGRARARSLNPRAARKIWIEIELLGYRGRYHQIKDDGSNGIDEIATEVFR